MTKSDKPCDRQRLGLDAAQWATFQAALDAPMRAPASAARLLRGPSVFET